MLYPNVPTKSPWNKGKLIGQRPPLKKQEIWSIRVRLELSNRVRDLAMFNLAIDSKLRACDLTKLKVNDIATGGCINARAVSMQQKTHQAVKFEITDTTRKSLSDWIDQAHLKSTDYLFPSRIDHAKAISTRQYARLVKGWVAMIGLDPSVYGTHSMRRTKATLIYKQTKNLRAVQLLLGHTKIESTVRYLGVEVDDALDMAEHIEL